MKKLRIICIGKLKTDCWKAAAALYIRRLNKWRAIELLELKDVEAPPGERSTLESKNILQRLETRDCAIALDEHGTSWSSSQLATFLKSTDERAVKRPTFIIGGPFGLSKELLQKCQICLSLSQMTLPHELARVVLLEQIYRAETIITGIPYHH